MVEEVQHVSGPALDPEALERLSGLMVDHDLAVLRVEAGARIGFESALDRLSLRFRALAPDVLCVLLYHHAIDRPALLALCGPHLPVAWIWAKHEGWRAVRPIDGRVLRRETDPLAPFTRPPA
ncbi:MAG: hypothetical protein ACODAG_09475 [Myxococcota bacterium]